jgi:hypothetical protein
MGERVMYKAKRLKPNEEEEERKMINKEEKME